MVGRVATLLLVTGVLWAAPMWIGCNGGATVGTLDDGRLFALNNLRGPNPEAGGTFTPYIYVIFEDVKIHLPWNMNYDGTSSGAGPIELTQQTGPLVGGTRVRLVYGFMLSSGTTFAEREVNVAIDGNMTVEFCMKDWWAGGYSEIEVKIRKGRWDAPDQLPPKVHEGT